MKFKFGRRKSVGTALDSGFDEKEPQPEPVGRASFSSGTLFSFTQRNRVASGHDSLDTNRLSSSSTLPSQDLPQTPNSNDEFPPVLRRPATYNSQSRVPGTAQSHLPPTNQKERKVLSRGSPRRMTMTTAVPPRLDTELDSTPLFSEDLFSPLSSTDVDPPAPKLAASRPFRADSVDSYDSAHFGEDGRRTQNEVSPKNVRASYIRNNPPTIPPPPPPKTEPQTRTTVMLIEQEHRLSTKLSWEESPTEQSVGLMGHYDNRDSNSPRNSRNLTPAVPQPKNQHSRNDSLSTPVIGGNRRQSRPSNDAGKIRRGSHAAQRHSVAEDKDADTMRRNIKSQILNSKPTIQPRGSTSTSSSAKLSPGGTGKDGDSGWEESVHSANSSVNSFQNTKDPNYHRVPALAAKRRASSPLHLNDAQNTPKPASAEPNKKDDDDNMFDPSLSASLHMVSQYEEADKKKRTTPKAMTAAEFEKLRQQKAQESDSDSEAIESSEDEDDEKQRRLAQKHRDRQDAQLSIMRQQLRKTSGTVASDIPPMLNRQTTAPMLSLNGSTPSISLNGGVSEEDEDEEIPLAVLQAHGFPNKNRPPTHLGTSNSNPNLRGAAQAQGGVLPPFARHLPVDPYLGATNLVNQPTRMSMAYGVGSSARSVAGGSVYGEPTPSVYGAPTGMVGRPGGLIGEIALAEEQRAARRNIGNYSPYRTGSPALNSSSEAVLSTGVGLLGMGAGGGPGPGGRPVSMMPQMSAPMLPSMVQAPMATPMIPGAVTPGADPASTQAQLEMMKMQLEILRLQEQLQRQQTSYQPPMADGRTMSLTTPQMGMGMNRPMSAYAPSIAPSTARSTMMPPRAVAPSITGVPPMQAPLMMQPPVIGGYTPSIAPSERSTIGQPSRYRPVSYNPNGSQSGRASTFNTNLSNSWNKLAASGNSGLRNSARADSDDEDWEKEAAKKAEKKSAWKSKKLGGLLGKKSDE